MNFSICKIFFAFTLLVFMMNNLHAQDEQSSSDRFVGIINFIDHEANRFVVSDLQYRMPLDMQVKSSSNRPLNRYALKVGQEISIKTRIKNNQAIADIVIISNIK